jgi:heptosyltransferase III
MKSPASFKASYSMTSNITGAPVADSMTDENILIVRPGALGDTILTLPLLETIRSIHPKARMTFLGNRSYRDLLPSDVAFERFDSAKWLWLVSSSQAELHRDCPRFDAAYLILKQPGNIPENLRRSGTPCVLHASPQPAAQAHLVRRLHEALDLLVPQPFPCLKHLAVQEKKNMVWVHPGSGGASKCAPLGLMVSLVGDLRRRTECSVAVTAGEEDAFLTELPEWRMLIDSPGTVVLERQPLRELCRILSPARLFLGNDSGISHLAAGLGVPAAVFFVKTDPQVWAPWVPRDQLHVIDLQTRDMTKIDLDEEVFEMLEISPITQRDEGRADR